MEPCSDDPAARLIISACSSDPQAALDLLAQQPTLAGDSLGVACATGNTGALARHLAAEPDAATRPTGPLRHPPLLYACFSRLGRARLDLVAGLRATVRTLLTAGADPNQCFWHDGWRQAPIYGAAGIANDAEITRSLLRAGADPNDHDDAHAVGEALYHAVEFADPTCAQLLVEAGTARRVVTHAVGRALNFDRSAMVAMLCAGGAQPTVDHLAQAVDRRRPSATLRALLDAGAPVDRPPGDPAPTPLQMAIRWATAEHAEILIDRGADPARVTAADRALGAVIGGRTGAVIGGRLGAVVGGRLGAVGPLADTLLITAVQQGDLTVVRRLLDAGARVTGDPARDAFPPIGEAAWRGWGEIVAELITRGAPLTYRGGGSALGAALHGSRHCHHPEGGPTMQIVQEIDRSRYAHTVQTLIAAGARLPEGLWPGAPPARQLIEELSG